MTPVQTSSCRVPRDPPPTCPGAGVTRAVDLVGRCPLGGTGGEPATRQAGCSPGRWGRSGCHRLGTPHSSPPPRSPEPQRGWQQTSLKSRSVTFSVAVCPHPHGPPAHRPTPPSGPRSSPHVPRAFLRQAGGENTASPGCRALPSRTTRPADFCPGCMPPRSHPSPALPDGSGRGLAFPRERPQTERPGRASLARTLPGTPANENL